MPPTYRIFELTNISALAVTVVFASLIVTNCRHDIRSLVSARNVFVLTLMMWFVLEACLLPAEILRFSQDTYDFGVLCVLCSGLAFVMVYHGSRGKLFDPFFRRLIEIDNPTLVWRVFVLGVFIGFIPLVVVAKGDIWLILEDAFVPHKRWASPFGRARYGGIRDAFMELQMFLKAAVPLAAAILVQLNQPRQRRVIAAVFITYMGSRALNSGTRSEVITVGLPILAAIYWRLPVAWKKRCLVAGLPSLFLLGLFWSAASVLGRNDGRLDWEGAADAEYVGFEMFRELLFLIDVVPRDYEFQMGYTYYVQLVNPIPRFLWHGKPAGDAGLQLANMKGAMYQGEAFMTISPGLVGEMYWNGGIPAVLLISGLLGFLARSWDRARALAASSILSFTVFAAGLGIIVVSGRSFNMNTLYGMIALFALLILFSGSRRSIPDRRITSYSRLPKEPSDDGRTIKASHQKDANVD